MKSNSNGGETGIRTLGRLSPSTVFETAPFDHSGTSPPGRSTRADLAVWLRRRKGISPKTSAIRLAATRMPLVRKRAGRLRQANRPSGRWRRSRQAESPVRGLPRRSCLDRGRASRGSGRPRRAGILPAPGFTGFRCIHSSRAIPVRRNPCSAEFSTQHRVRMNGRPVRRLPRVRSPAWLES